MWSGGNLLVTSLRPHAVDVGDAFCDPGQPFERLIQKPSARVLFRGKLDTETSGKARGVRGDLRDVRGEARCDNLDGVSPGSHAHRMNHQVARRTEQVPVKEDLRLKGLGCNDQITADCGSPIAAAKATAPRARHAAAQPRRGGPALCPASHAAH
jgi:hypothetical protein